ncbi:2-dehydro-3-deoxygalactonokinase [Ancylobacter pratisalsi]|uniref:2-dehydro-3-deoxygalactonokinase n=2 Tax=Ancylobacter pratisalsi TaxID=1745854 RepID=A0A6P1YT59_9HYPH|nr:2-dehydro-3-deoxygalactonokinase [Ancylobacter pratisalsi]
MEPVSHIVVDWGTSSFRLWALDRAGQVLAERRSTQGLAASATDGFEVVLETHIAALGIGEDVPVMMCGMVGSRSGWIEAAYLAAPVPLAGLAAQTTLVPSTRRPIHVLPGIAQNDPHHFDVMRGEETQLLALTTREGACLACLPGTHSKWVRLEDGTIEGFASFMTGELFQLIREASVLAPALSGAAPVEPASPAFAEGVAEALAAPESIGNALFALRASWLLAATPATSALARLSGLLIGLELAGARQRFGNLDGVSLIASAPAAPLYRQAFAVAGLADIRAFDAESCVREGLHAAALATFQLEGAVS